MHSEFPVSLRKNLLLRRKSLLLQTVLPFISHTLIYSSRYSSATCSENLGQYGQLYGSIRHCNSYQQRPLRNVIWQMNYKLLHECESSNDTVTGYWLTTGIQYPQTSIFPFTAVFTPFTVVINFPTAKASEAWSYSLVSIYFRYYECTLHRRASLWPPQNRKLTVLPTFLNTRNINYTLKNRLYSTKCRFR